MTKFVNSHLSVNRGEKDGIVSEGEFQLHYWQKSPSFISNGLRRGPTVKDSPFCRYHETALVLALRGVALLRFISLWRTAHCPMHDWGPDVLMTRCGAVAPGNASETSQAFRLSPAGFLAELFSSRATIPRGSLLHPPKSPGGLML